MKYLLLAVFFGSSIAVFLKYLRRCGVGIGETICVNYIVATLVGIVVNAARYDLHINPLGEFWCWMAFHGRGFNDDCCCYGIIWCRNVYCRVKGLICGSSYWKLAPFG